MTPAAEQPPPDPGLLPRPGLSDTAAVMRVVDKLDKIGPDAVAEQLIEQAGLSGAQAKATLALADIVTPDLSFAERVRDLGVSDPLLEQGLEELTQVVQGATEVNSDRIGVTADLRIARGLDYYTGTVYETRLSGAEQLGSICSGGRYDSLATDGAQSYPGVGISFGVTRALGPLFARGELVAPAGRCPAASWWPWWTEAGRARSRSVAAALRARGIAAEVAPKAAEVRQADPLRGPAGHPVRLVPRGRRCRRRPCEAPPTTWPARSRTSEAGAAARPGGRMGPGRRGSAPRRWSAAGRIRAHDGAAHPGVLTLLEPLERHRRTPGRRRRRRPDPPARPPRSGSGRAAPRRRAARGRWHRAAAPRPPPPGGWSPTVVAGGSAEAGGLLTGTASTPRAGELTTEADRGPKVGPWRAVDWAVPAAISR